MFEFKLASSGHCGPTRLSRPTFHRLIQSVSIDNPIWQNELCWIDVADSELMQLNWKFIGVERPAAIANSRHQYRIESNFRMESKSKMNFSKKELCWSLDADDAQTRTSPVSIQVSEIRMTEDARKSDNASRQPPAASRPPVGGGWNYTAPFNYSVVNVVNSNWVGECRWGNELTLTN